MAQESLGVRQAQSCHDRHLDGFGFVFKYGAIEPVTRPLLMGKPMR
jgi:hypothetical protein